MCIRDSFQYSVRGRTYSEKGESQSYFDVETDNEQVLGIENMSLHKYFYI